MINQYSYIACPHCSDTCTSTDTQLQCTSCNRTYEIKDGIPIMYHEDTDLSHVEEEIQLATMMKRDVTSSKDAFSLKQWDISKKEFWNMVQSTIAPAPKSIVNLGCGFDPMGKIFQDAGYTFVHFDVVHQMLHELQTKHKVTDCIAGDILHLPFKAESFDYVVSIDVIHHEIDNLEQILTACHRILKSGGTLYLEDPNAWGMFQFVKSVLMPRALYRWLRNTYHTYKGSTHRPADYEFPTNVWKVKRLLQEIGFTDIVVSPQPTAYPNIGPYNYRIYTWFRWMRWVRTYHNYHYMLRAVKR